MPISGASSYLPTADEFIAHWVEANAALPAPLTLRDGTAIADLQALRNALAGQITALIGKTNEREFARGSLNTSVPAILKRLKQFNLRVRMLFAENSRFVNALPKVPIALASRSKVTGPLDHAASIWAKVDAAGAPVTLSGAYALADFNADLAALKANYSSYGTAKAGIKLARATRNELQGKIYAVLKQYREAIPTRFAEESAIVQAMPRLTPLRGDKAMPEAVSL